MAKPKVKYNEQTGNFEQVPEEQAAPAAEQPEAPSDGTKAKVFAPATRQLNEVMNTPDWLVQGIEKPTINRPDVTGTYQAAMPKTEINVSQQAQEGKFNATAGTAVVPTPASTQGWTSQVSAPNVAGVWQGVNAPQNTYQASVAQGQAAAMSPELLNQLMAASRGQGPSAAQAQLQSGIDQAIAAQQAQVAASRGAINPAVLRQQQQQLAQATQQQAGQAAGLAAQEQQQAMQTAAQALAQQRGIESEEKRLETSINAEIAAGNTDRAMELVRMEQGQKFDALRQESQAINDMLRQGQIGEQEAQQLQAELNTRVSMQNADVAFKAAQGDQAASLKKDELTAQITDQMMKMGLSYDQAQLEADQYWASLVTAGRELQTKTAAGIYAAKQQIKAAAAGRTEQSGGGFFDKLTTGLITAGAGMLSNMKFSSKTDGTTDTGGTADTGGDTGGQQPTYEAQPTQTAYSGGVITQNGVAHLACGGVAKPRVNMAQGGTVQPQAVASGGLAVRPAILEQQQMQQPSPAPMTGAPVPGDSPANDTVPAQLSPGEVVIPRSAVASGRSGILSFIDALDREGKLGEARQIASTPNYGEVLQAKQKLKKA